MKPRHKLAESKTPSGNIMGLYEQDGAYSINIGGQELMHSRANASECLLGSLGMARLKKKGGLACAHWWAWIGVHAQ